MITLGTADIVFGIAGTATAVSYSVYGMETLNPTTYRRLAQGQLPTSAAILYTVHAAWTLIHFIILTNTTGSSVSGVTLYIGGSLATNQITGSLTLPANGTLTLNCNGLHFTTSVGALAVAAH